MEFTYVVYLRGKEFTFTTDSCGRFILVLSTRKPIIPKTKFLQLVFLFYRYDIETKIAEGSGRGIKPSRVPWKALVLSMPVWAIVVCHGCSVFGYFTVVNQLPSYMKSVLHFKIKENGLLSSLPYLGK